MGIDTKRTDGDTRKHSVKEEVKVAEQERQEIMDEVIITTSGNLANLKTKVCNDLKNTGKGGNSDVDYMENNKYLKYIMFYAEELFCIPNDIVKEYMDVLKQFCAPSEIGPYIDMNDKLKEHLGFGSYESYIDEQYGVKNKLKYDEGVVLYYVKKCCPNKYNDISFFMLQMHAHNKDATQFIKKYGDTAYDILKFCYPFDGTYMKTAMSNYVLGDTQIFDEKKEHLELGSMRYQFCESFALELESTNLFSFLKEYPQKLDNLGGKEIKSIDLNINLGINFAFRGIIEMVKSRPDIDFPHLSESASDAEKRERKQQREKIIKEYESMLRNYIAKDNIDDPGAKGKTFDKIFFSMPNRDGVIEGYMHRSLPKNWIQQFSGNEVSDYSFNGMVDSEEKIKETSFKMISDIEKYVKEHPNEKILVCVEQHGGSDGASCNGWTKEDWIKLANISPNIKIRSIRCFFGAAYNNKDIYNHKSSVSGFSNRYKASPYVAQPIKQALDKGLGFHEMEIYTRLNYPISVAPLTESMEYTNWSTGKIEISKIGLAQNDRLENINFNDYA